MWVQMWRESGLSQTEFARVHGLGLAAFRHWLSKERSAVESARTRAGHFVSVVNAPLAMELGTKSDPVLVRWGGLEVVFAEPPPVAWLRQLVEEPC